MHHSHIIFKIIILITTTTTTITAMETILIPSQQQQQFQHNNNNNVRPPPPQQQQQRNYNPPQPQISSLQPNQHQIGSSTVQITNSKRKHKDVHYVILDSGAFIGRQNFFNNFNENVRYYMTPAVNNEIRDKQSRTFLDNFPYEIIVKKPDPQSVAFGMLHSK